MLKIRGERKRELSCKLLFSLRFERPGAKKALLRANRDVRQNREGMIETMMAWIKVDRESAAATYDSTWKIFSEDDSMTESGLKLVIDQGRGGMKIDRPVGISEVAEHGLLREVHKELGIKSR
jgi:hypothetical protein